ncbi:hypothetical protein BDV93DRAFT_515910, partial [Ceratobasidium sp. AG-I]
MTEILTTCARNRGSSFVGSLSGPYEKRFDSEALVVMLQSIFRDQEKDLLLSFRDQWEGLKGSGKQRDEFGDLVNAKDDLIDLIVQDFFEAFPERDITRSPNNILAFSQNDRDKLHTRIRQLFYNETRRDNKQDKANLKIKNPLKRVSLEILFKQ